MSRAVLLPSTSPADASVRTPGTEDEESKQSRRVLQHQPESPGNGDQAASDLTNPSGSIRTSRIPVRNGSSGPASLAKVQVGYCVQGTESKLPDDGLERVQAMSSTPETIHYSLQSDADSETIASGVKQTDQTVTYVNTTKTEVEERKSMDVQQAERAVTVREGTVTVQPRRDVSTFSQTTAGLQRYGTQSFVQDGIQKSASLYQETHFPTVTESGQSPVIFSASKPIDTRRFVVPSKTAYSSVREQFLQIERLHREEKDRIVAMITDEYEDYKRSCEQQFEAFQMENERLLREISAATSRIIVLETQLSARGDVYSGGASQYDKVEFNITTITTNITTITATITTITTRFEQWKQTVAKDKGQLTISSKELEQLSLDLSNTSSRMTELQQHYAELSRYFGSIRHELQVTLSLREEKDHTITSLTTEVTQWKNADAAKAQRITAARQENETLRRDLSAASSRTAELQQRYDAQSTELGSARDELRTKVSLVEERDRTIGSFTAEVARWKQSDATKTEQIAIARRDYEKLQKDLSASSQTAELQKRYDAQSKELGSVRTELRANKSLVEEKERIITTLTAQIEQWKRADAAKENHSAAEHRDKEKLQKDFEALSSQTADLQKRYDAQSRDIVSIRNELQAKVSLLEQKELIISSLTTEVAQGKREDSVKAEQIAAARGDVEQLRLELSSSSSRFADLQQRYEAQTKEFATLRDEVRRIKMLYCNGADQARDGSSEQAVSQQIVTALEEKNKEMEELRRDLATSNTRNVELQKSYEELSREISAVRDELKVKTSRNENTITSLTAQVDQWKRADTTKAQRIAITLKQVEKLQQDLSVSASQLTELQGRYDTQSREFIATRKEFQDTTSSNEGKDRTIAFLTAEVDHWKRTDGNKAEQIATTLKQIEKLQRLSSASAFELAELQGRYEAQSRELISVRNELKTKASLHEGKDELIASLTAELDHSKHADATRAEQIETTIKQVEKLKRDLSASATQLIDLQSRYEVQSRDLVSVRNQLQTKTSSYEEISRTVVALTTQVEEWTRTDAVKEERILTARKQVEDLQRDLTDSSSRITQLQQRCDLQAKDLSSLQDQLRDKVSGKDRAFSFLLTEVEEWKRSDASKTEELTIARKDLEQLHRDLATSSSQIAELQQRYESRSKEFTSQIESWKRSDASKTEELTAARKDLEQLRRNLATLSSQISELKQRYETRSTEFTSQIESWKRSDTSKTEELTVARKDLEQLRRNLATSSSQIAEFQERYESQSKEFSIQTESWNRSDVAKTEELTAARKDLEQLRRDLSTSSSQIIEYQQRFAAESAQSVELTSQIEKWKRSNAVKAEELATAREKIERFQVDLSISSSRIIEFQEHYEAQSTELRSLREELQVTHGEKDRTVARLNDQIEQWKLADAAKAEELTRARRDVEQLQLRLSASSSQIEELEKYYAEQVNVIRHSSSVSEKSKSIYEKITTEVKDYAAVIRLTSTVDQWLRADAKRAEDLVLELDQRKRENEELRHHLDTLKEIYIRAPELKQIFQSETIEIQRRHEEEGSIELKSVIAERQSQMGGVQVLVTTVDTYADTTIIEMLQKLNAEVQQSTIFLAERMIEDFRPWAVNLNQEQTSAVQRVSESIGQVLEGCLGSKERHDVALFLPIAFQAYITYYLRSLISSWTIEKGNTSPISKTYGQSQQSEAQTISGRGGSRVTRAYISSAPDTPISATMSGLSDIVVAAGCAPSPSAAKAKVWSHLGDKLSSIISIAGQFSKMIREVVSADLEVSAVHPLQIFEETTMEDVNGYGRGQGMTAATGQKVLCSTQMGLTKRIQLESGKSDILTVIKAKVVLESFLHDQA